MEMKRTGMEDKKSETGEKDARPSYFKNFGRIALIFFIGISIYFLVSTLVLIFLTKPEKEVKVPPVIGKQFVVVYNSLSRMGLNPEISFYDVYDIDNGIILNQYPESGSIVSEGDRIKLVVSRSSLYVDVPNLVGIELPLAINKLKNLHVYNRTISLGAGIISYIPSERSADNIVIEQSPKAGEKITPDRKINLLVSAGKLDADDRMPEVVGQSIDLCYDLLIAKGLNVIEEIVDVSKREGSGIVIAQNPSKGSGIKKGGMAKLRIGFFASREHPYMAYEKIEYTIARDGKNGLYEAYIEDHRPRRLRFSRAIKPGNNVRFIFHRQGNAKVSILCDKRLIKVIGINVDEFK